MLPETLIEVRPCLTQNLNKILFAKNLVHFSKTSQAKQKLKFLNRYTTYQNKILRSAKFLENTVRIGNTLHCSRRENLT